MPEKRYCKEQFIHHGHIYHSRRKAVGWLLTWETTANPTATFADVHQGLGVLYSIPPSVSEITLKIFLQQPLPPLWLLHFLCVPTIIHPLSVHCPQLSFCIRLYPAAFSIYQLTWPKHPNPFCIRSGGFYCFPHTTLI